MVIDVHFEKGDTSSRFSLITLAPEVHAVLKKLDFVTAMRADLQ